MRLKIIIDVADQLILPINYTPLLTGVIYRFLVESDAEYAAFLHDEGYTAGAKRFKLFTFSQLLAKQRRILDDNIHFGSTIAWYVSSPMERFLSHFADTLLTQGRLSLGRRELQIKDVSIPRIPRFQTQMRLRCLSPIVMSTVRQRDGKQTQHYCLPDDPALSELIRQNLMRKHEAIYGQPPKEDALRFRFDTDYINSRHRRVTRLVDYKGTQIRGVMAPFYVSGSVALIQTGYECGFGVKNSIGFGMAEV
ncbi:MAG: CRISPR-associated endoribonuclease Cas6 [Candidatus Poribacteria bacterium]|nr:CRISPR-associated endoribonuclease Cas6 [Candidatus Poribacteria bacterium]